MAASSILEGDKTNARPKRHSNPAPLEVDSDSDFNPGAYVPETTKKSKGKSKASRDSASSSRKRRRGTLDDDVDYNSVRRKTPKVHREPMVQNSLAEYFKDVDLGLREEEEEEEEEREHIDDTDDDVESRSSGSEDEDVDPIIRKAHMTLLPQSYAPRVEGDSRVESETESESGDEIIPVPDPSVLRLKSQSMSQCSDGKKAEPEEGSVTEPESDDDNLKMLESSKTAANGPGIADESVTEPESDDELVIPNKAGPSNTIKTAAAKSVSVSRTDSQSSVTEPESDDDITVDLQPRPAFELKPEQSLEPLVLDATTHIQVPGRINTYLREYQRDGIRFFWERYNEGRGGLLGDDMGLVDIGKTIQVISFLSAIMSKHGDVRDIGRRHKHVSHLQDLPEWKKHRKLPPANATWPTCLIIAPSSVVGNWEREFETWGYFDVGMYIGTPSERADVLNEFRLGRLDVVLTSFDLARIDSELLCDMAWSCVIVDEVHRMKNPRAKLTEKFSKFACPIRFGLTGTAIQNSYMELWTILNWTNPGRVGTKKQWEGYVVRPLTKGQSKTASEGEHLRAALVAQILRDKLLPKFFLRRTKSIIKDQLPRKIDEVVFCPLASMQVEVYKRILATEAVQNMIHKDDPCDCGSNLLRRKCCHPFDKGDLFKYMSTLIKVSNHLALILPSPTDTAEQTARNRELAQIAFPSGNIPRYGSAMLVPQFCGKWLVLETLLREWHKDLSNKVLIFTKSVKLLEMLEFHLGSQGLGFLKLDGSTKQSDRMPMIDQFHADPDVFVFLISTMAGGTGLNLTGANKVVIFDPNWNPAHDLQAMDRAYRFGQTRDVSVYRLLGAGSIEELIYARQIYKQQQMHVGYDASFQTRYFEGVQGEKSKPGELFGIKNIFKFHEDTLATKMAIEQATVSDLDWALAHMDVKKQSAKKRTEAEAWVYEAEKKTSKEDGELRGLGALLFDDEAPQVKGDDDLQKTLNDIGVNYTHRNDELMMESTIEGQRFQASLQEKKKALKKARAKRKAAASEQASQSPEPEWPPKRRHHKAPPSPRTKLLSRQRALIELGMIDGPPHLPVFAQEFARKSSEEQAAILAELDAHAKTYQA